MNLRLLRQTLRWQRVRLLVVLVAGQKIADGPPQEAIRNPEVERAYLGE